MVYIILGTGFEETEAVAPYDILKRGGVDVHFAAVSGKEVAGAHGIRIAADCSVNDIDVGSTEMIVVPGGMGGVESVEKCDAALDAIRNAYNSGLRVAAICAGPRVLAGLGILAGKAAVCYPGMESEMNGGVMAPDLSVVTSGRVTTGRGPGDALEFGFELLKILKGADVAERVAGGMCYEG